jgi:hypothetical protein
MDTSVKMEATLMGTTSNDPTPQIQITTRQQGIRIPTRGKQGLVQKITPPKPITMERVKIFTLDQKGVSTTSTTQDEKYMCQSVGNKMKHAKRVALVSLIIFQLTSCALIPASSSPEIESLKQEKIKSGKIDEGYQRVFICMGEVSINMPENLLMKKISNIPRNSKIYFAKNEKLLGSINFNEVAVFDYREIEMIKYEWSNEIKPIDSAFGDGKIGQDSLFLDFNEPITELSIGMSSSMGRRVGGFTIMRMVPGTRFVTTSRAGGKIIGDSPNRADLQKKSGECSNKKIVLYEKF